MNRKILLVAITFLVLAGLGIAVVPPPPANQNIGAAYDTSVNQLVEQNCRNCHTSGVPDRHHNLVPTGEYNCNNCHPVVTGPNGQSVLLDRNCIACHNGSAFYANANLKAGRPHHNTTWAQVRNCKQCHGAFVDNYNDGHYIPTYNVSLVTPDTSYNASATNATTGKKWGGCEACHEADLGATPDILANVDTHHNTIMGVTQGYDCTWCHYGSGLPYTGKQAIRQCETCHSVSTIHNIQYNYTQTNGQKGYGHIGDNWDCLGCHAWYNAGSSGFEGAIIPDIASLSPSKLASNKAATVTISGSDFLSGIGTYTSVVVLDDTTTLTPSSMTDNQIVVNIPALSAGVHTVKVVKNGDWTPKPSDLTSLTVVDPVDATLAKITKKATKTTPAEITITGTGFGPKPDQLTDPLYSEHGVYIVTGGKTVKTTINSWTDTKIVVTTPKANIGNPVTVKAIPGQDTVNIS